MTSPNCIDLSNYTLIPTASQVQCLRAQGIVRAIVGTSFGSVARAQLAALDAGGIETQEYVFPGHAPISARRWWIDCETPGATQASIRGAASAGAYGAYTRKGWWEANVGGWNIVAEFPHLKLWEAHYADPPPAFVPFGGWTARTIIQYAQNVDLCPEGQRWLNVDLNVVEDFDLPHEEEEMVLAACTDSPTGYRLYFTGDQPPRWILSQAEADALIALHGQPKFVGWGQIWAAGYAGSK